MAFWNLFKPLAKKLENPLQPITPAIIMASLGMAGGSYDTSPDCGALRFTPIFAAERIISETLATFPLLTYERIDNDGKRRTSAIAQYQILHDAPNESQTPFAFWDSVVKTAIRKGNAYVYIEWNGANEPKNLRLLDSTKVTVIYVDGVKRFSYQNGEYVFGVSDVLHIMGFSNDGLTGVPLLTYAVSAVELGMAAEASAMKLFSQGSIFGAAIELTAWPSDAQMKQLRESWEARYAGPENHHKVPIIPGGKLNPGTSNLEQMQFLELRRWQLLEVCRLFRIPPHMMADLERATFSNIEQQSRDFITSAIRPWLIKIEQEINLKLFSPTQRKQYFAEFQIDDLLRGDTKTRYETYQIGKIAGILTTNEIRRWENLPPVDGGDTLLQPLNMAPSGGSGTAAAKTDPPIEGEGEDEGEDGNEQPKA